MPVVVRRPWVLALAALLTLGACGDGSSSAGPRVDTEEVEGILLQRQKERYPSLKFGQATCPNGILARSGETFECSVTVEGQPARFRVTIAEVVGERARYEFRPVRAVVDVLTVTVFLKSRLEEAWRMATVDCGPAKVRVLDVGGVIECTASNGTAIRHIQAVVEDRDGTVTLRER
ncbi:MAG: DUF4333 domain-containing protein [Acidimicrobiales bacterium]